MVSLATNEYFGSVDREAMSVPVVTCHFKEHRARRSAAGADAVRQAGAGLMARYAIDHRIDRAEG